MSSGKCTSVGDVSAAVGVEVSAKGSKGAADKGADGGISFVDVVKVLGTIFAILSAGHGLA